MNTILIIMGRYLPGYKDGGPVRSIKNLTDRLGNEYHFRILTADRDHGDDAPYPGIKANEWNKTGNAQVYYVNPDGFTKEIIRNLAAEADMVYLCGCFNNYARTTLELKRSNRISCKVVIASMGLFSPGAFQIKKWKKSIYMRLLKSAGYFKNIEWSATSQEEVDQIKNILGTSAVCHIAQDLPRQAETRIRPIGKQQGELNIIFLSRISKKKNLSYAVDLLQNLKGKITFDIYGTMEDENYWKECEEKLKKLPDNIVWSYKGEADAEKVIDIFSNYHVFLFPTLGENYGHVIYEAMAGGCIPVISDQTPWKFQENLKGGINLPLKDSEKWTRELQQFVNMNREEISEYSLQAVQCAIKESECDSADGYRKIFDLTTKILFLTNIPSPYRVHFFEELSCLCELTVLYEKKDASDRNDNWIQRDHKVKKYTEIFMKSALSGSSSAFCPGVTSYLNKSKYDLIVVGVYSTLTGMYAIAYMKMMKIPYIISCDGGISGNTTSLKAKLKKFLIGGAKAWLSTGELCDQYLCSYGGKRENIYQYPFTSLSENDIQRKVPSREEKQLLKTELSIPENKIILSVGQFIYRKGYDILLEAANNMKDEYGIYIIGGSPTEEYLKIMETYHLKNIHFLDFMPKQELEKYYLAADLFVLPTREDIWGLVINEAMAAGLPVVTTTNCVAGMELIADKKCLVPVNDSETLSKIILDIMQQDDYREALAAENLLKIRNYTFENMAKRHMEIFKDIIMIRNQ